MMSEKLHRNIKKFKKRGTEKRESFREGFGRQLKLSLDF